MKTNLITFLFLTLVHYGISQNKPRQNPFLEELGLTSMGISKQKRNQSKVIDKRDTIKIEIQQGKLWNFDHVVVNGIQYDHGDFENGNGTLKFQRSGSLCVLDFKNGILSGKSLFYFTADGLDLRFEKDYLNGFLHGKSIQYSTKIIGKPSSITYFENGYKTKHENYGFMRVKFFLFLAKATLEQPDKLCSVTIFEKGKLISHECFDTKKDCQECHGH